MKKNLSQTQKSARPQETKTAVSREKKSANSKQKVWAEENLQKEIQELAYQFYLERGGHHGSDKEDWYRAEKTLKGKKLLKK